MPHNSDVATNGQRPTLWRHMVAVPIDLTIIACSTALAMAVMHERFTVLGTMDGSPRFSTADQDRINRIDQSFNRAVRLGDEIYTLSGSGWWLTMLVLTATTIAVFVATPALTGRRTPGQCLLGTARAAEATELILINTAPGIDLSDASDPSIATESVAPTAPPPDRSPLSTADDASADPALTETVDIRTDASIELADISRDDSMGDEPDETPYDTSHDNADDSVDQVISIDADRTPALPIMLADEADYQRWDREEAVSRSRSTSGSTMTEPTRTRREATPVSPPEWSAEWKAWMYWDPSTERWFKHDADSDRWSPVS